MKRLTHIVATVAVALVMVTGQTYAQNMRAGVNAGVGFANLSGDIESYLEASAKAKTGFSGGAFFGVDLARMFRVQLNGQYVQKGTKFEDAAFNVEGKVKLTYIELLLPLTLLIPIEGSAITPRLYGGPSVAFEATCKIEVSFPETTDEVDCSDPDIEAPTASVDVGVFFGGGIDFAVGAGEITLDVLYDIGLTNINTFDEPDPDVIRNTNLQILLGYAFLLGS